MGMAGSPDIFQAKMSELMMALEFVRTYLDDVLSITNEGKLRRPPIKAKVSISKAARGLIENQCLP